MAWVDLSTAFESGTTLTSTQMQNLRDNLQAMMDGDTGAPRLECEGFVNPSAGENVMQVSPDFTVESMTGSYVKYCEVIVLFDGKIRVKQTINNTQADIAYTRVYVNGVATGTEHTQSGAGSNSVFDDITVSCGDLVQIYCKRQSIPGGKSVTAISYRTDVNIAGQINHLYPIPTYAF
ncbi:MAG: hypothetical protein N0C89_07920 [Candidatus Thiodiazotropha endolucinida]|nr:hypothetical protein [Candidatus Thiodiazotropha taylori]MCG8093846.1 hypothetical protein [Candidatus Thiodiazotropha endolucinida]MCG8060879.1 hypothetical protein [Candidatus Thiodiazotropha taylori]MCG8064074.1 hypothetical protein [Candidatus Thiodiazotropha taylori]MCG8072621.1 hypothetical protein [Candidatus Thiodiazotropha taylori]